jgi:hypothetical protein
VKKRSKGKIHTDGPFAKVPEFIGRKKFMSKEQEREAGARKHGRKRK